MGLMAIMAAGLLAGSAQAGPSPEVQKQLIDARARAEADLRMTFGKLQFENFGPAPLKGPIYQAVAGGRMIYYAPESQHIIFGSVYSKDGLNVTALDQEKIAAQKISRLDTSVALALGPKGAPEIVEFTDPDCPYCRAYDRFIKTKAAAGKPVRRLVIFVAGIHPEAASKAEHILCSPDPEREFELIYQGYKPADLRTCPEGEKKLAQMTGVVRSASVTGTPTLVAGGKVISGFRQDELEAWLTKPAAAGGR